MANAIDALDACSNKLDEAQRVVKQTRRVVGVVAGIAMVGGLGLLLWRIFGTGLETSNSKAVNQKDGV